MSIIGSPFPENVSIHFTTKAGGVSLPPFASNNLGLHVEDNAQHVLENRQRLQQQLAVGSIQWLKQVHGNTAIQAQAEMQSEAADNAHAEASIADAQFTQQTGLACAILTADCLPVLFADLDGSQVAAAHAGWRGLSAGVLLSTLNSFPEPNKVIVCFGAAIGQDAFEVGQEVKTAFPWASDKCFRKGLGTKHQANLYQLAFEQLQKAGVTEIYQAVFNHNNAETVQIKPYQEVTAAEQPCTYAQKELFYSYRRDQRTGRQASLIWKV